VALTVACALAYAAAGMSAFDAVNHAMATLATGGFSTHDASFAAFRNPALEWIGVLFMVAGALPFVLFVRAARGEPGPLARDPQVRALIVFLAVVCFGFAVWLTLTGAFPFATALRLVAFNVVSIVTTTGFASADYTQWGAFAVGLFFFLTFVGGCTGSTAGAIKIYRFMILAQVIRRQVRNLANPSRVERMRYGGRRIPEDVPPSVLAFLALYVGTTAIVTLVLAAMGLDLVTALSSAATAVGNVGPGLGEIVGPAGNFAPLPDAAKLVLSAAMILGRLELFTVFVLCDPQFWRW
jgi:trk system potassium uptake protein